jgi:ribosomal-protein-alanine N-acetyltransferase
MSQSRGAASVTYQVPCPIYLKENTPMVETQHNGDHNFPPVPEIIETSRLYLRPPCLEDAGLIFALYAQDKEVTKHLSWRSHKSLEETHMFLNTCLTHWQRGPRFPWVILRREDGQLLGMIEMRFDAHGACIGYVLAKAFWGQGYAPEATQAVTDWVLAQEGIYRVWAVCDVDNQASARVLEKVGMQREGVLRKWMVSPNLSHEPQDCYAYSKVKNVA